MMRDGDPFVSVKEDVQKTVTKADKLYLQWTRAQRESLQKEEISRLGSELNNTLRGIEWDLEELQETIGAVEKSPGKFSLSNADIGARKEFVNAMKLRVRELRAGISSITFEGALSASAGSKPSKNKERQSLLTNHGQEKYGNPSSSSLVAEENRKYAADTLAQQQLLIEEQDEHIDHIGSSVRLLKDISMNIGNELDDQTTLLDDLGHEMDNTGSRLDGTLKKIAKVTSMTGDGRQWCAIGVLVVILIVIIILLAVLH